MTTEAFVSYAVGCMFGRHSPDKEGFIFANKGETIKDHRISNSFCQYRWKMLNNRSGGTTMTPLFKVFASSVQKELEDERLIIQNLVNTDPFLSAHCTPVLYKYEPASAGKVLESCMRSLDNYQMSPVSLISIA